MYIENSYSNSKSCSSAKLEWYKSMENSKIVSVQVPQGFVALGFPALFLYRYSKILDFFADGVLM